MPRPRKPRWIDDVTGEMVFLPGAGEQIPVDAVVLSADEREALRLCDYRGLDQSGAAERMQVSRPTLGRILQVARNKVASALIDGKPIVMAGFSPPGQSSMSRRQRRGKRGPGGGRGRRGGWYTRENENK
jgi:predicted DNA-binding protein (UPF0251 family)